MFKQIICLISSCMSSLYILGINILLDVSFANIFSHSVSGLFGFFLIVSFAMQKPFRLLVHFLFLFCFPCLRHIKKIFFL